MSGESSNSVQKKKTVLVAGAEDLCLILNTELHDKIDIVKAGDFQDARKAFNDDRPALIICGFDGDGRQFSPLLRTAGRYRVPVLSVASSEEAVDALGGVIKWAVDRRNVAAVVSLSKKLLHDPTYKPTNPGYYSPPPKSTVSGISDSGVKVLKSHILNAHDEAKEKEPDAPEPDSLLGRLEGEIKAAIRRAWDESTTHFLTQSKELIALLERVEALEDHTKTMHTDLGEMINAVAVEGVSLNDEVKEAIEAAGVENKAMQSEIVETIDNVTEDTAVALDELRATLNGFISKAHPSSPDLDQHVERLSSSIAQRTSELDSLQTAIEDVQNKGIERETALQKRIDIFSKRFDRLEQALNGGEYSGIEAGSLPIGVPSELIEDLDQKFADIEASISEIVQSRPSAGGGVAFTKQFEDIWDTQTLLTNLQDRIVSLEEKGNVSVPSVDPTQITSPGELNEVKQIQADLTSKVEILTKRFSAAESAIEDFERRFSEIARAPRAQFSALEQRIAGIEKNMSGLETPSSEGVDVAKQFEKLRETQATILQRINTVEKSSSVPPPPTTNAQKMASIQRWQSTEKRIAGIESAIARLEGALTGESTDTEIRQQIEEIQRIQSLMFQPFSEQDGKDAIPSERVSDRGANYSYEERDKPDVSSTVKSWPSRRDAGGESSVTQRTIIRADSSIPPKSATESADVDATAKDPEAREERSNTLTEFYASLEKFHDERRVKDKDE